MKSLVAYFFLFLLSLGMVPAVATAAEPPAQPLDVAQFLKSLRDPDPPLQVEALHTIRQAKLNHLCFSADVSRVAAVHEDNIIFIWNTKTGERVSPVNYRCTGKITSLALSPTGKYVLIGRQEHNALLGESEAIKVSAVYKGLDAPVRAAAITPDEKQAIFCLANGDIVRYPLLGGEPMRFAKNPNDVEDYNVFQIMPSGTQVVVGGLKAKRLRLISLPQGYVEKLQSQAIQTELPITSVALTDKQLIFNHGKDIFFRNRPDGSLDRSIQAYPSMAQWLSVSADGKRLVAVSGEGNVEIRDLIAPGIDCKVSLQHGVRHCAIGSDGRTLATIKDNGFLVLERLPERVDSTRLRVTRTLHELLAAKDYEGLEAIFQQTEADTTPLAWAPNRTLYAELCTLLATPPGRPTDFAELAKAIEQWSAERTLATAPKIMMTQNMILSAWAKRGGGTANTVTIFGALGFEAYVKKAEKLIVPICDGETPPPFAYSLLFTVAMAQQWDEERLNPYIEKLLSQAPHCIEAHAALATAYLPRWGGAPADLSDYAARVGDLIGGDAGDGAYARFAMSQYFLHPPNQIFAGTGLDYDRTKRGLQYLAEKAPDGAFAACFGAWFAIQEKDPAALEAFCALLNTQANGRHLSLIWPAELANFRGDYHTIRGRLAALAPVAGQ